MADNAADSDMHAQAASGVIDWLGGQQAEMQALLQRITSLEALKSMLLVQQF